MRPNYESGTRIESLNEDGRKLNWIISAQQSTKLCRYYGNNWGLVEGADYRSWQFLLRGRQLVLVSSSPDIYSSPANAPTTKPNLHASHSSSARHLISFIQFTFFPNLLLFSTISILLTLSFNRLKNDYLKYEYLFALSYRPNFLLNILYIWCEHRVRSPHSWY